MNEKKNDHIQLNTIPYTIYKCINSFIHPTNIYYIPTMK